LQTSIKLNSYRPLYKRTPQGTTIGGNNHASKHRCHAVTYSPKVSYPYLLSAAVAYPASPQRNAFTVH